MRNFVRAGVLTVAGFGVCLGPCSNAAGSGYAIQIGAYPQLELAEKLKAEVESSTAPVYIQTHPLPIRKSYDVFLGPYKSYMDAWAVSRTLPSSFPVKGKITPVSEREAVDGKSSVPRSASDASLFPPLPVGTAPRQEPMDQASFVTVTVAEAGEASEALLKKPVASMSRSELLSVGFNGKSNAEGVPALERFLSQNASDSVANAARLRLARRLLGRRDFARVHELLEKVASTGTAEERGKAALIGAYAASPQKGAREGYRLFAEIASDASLSADLRSLALRTAAGHAHTAKEYTSAVLAFRQLESQAPSVQERHEASLQLCGLQFELVGCAKGSWDEVIVSCDAICTNQEIKRELRATANLMRFEAMFHAGFINEALAACEEHLRIYPDISREFISASTWHGALLVHADRRDDAVQVLKSVLELEIASTDKFGGHEPKARAAYWLAFVALQQSDYATRDHYVNYIKVNYPKSHEASKLASLQPAQ